MPAATTQSGQLHAEEALSASSHEKHETAVPFDPKRSIPNHNHRPLQGSLTLRTNPR